MFSISIGHRTVLKLQFVPFVKHCEHACSQTEVPSAHPAESQIRMYGMSSAAVLVLKTEHMEAFDDSESLVECTQNLTIKDSTSSSRDGPFTRQMWALSPVL